MHQLKYHYPLLYDLVQYWPVAVFLPSLLLLIAALALVTRQWDRHDARVARERARRAVGQPAGAGNR